MRHVAFICHAFSYHYTVLVRGAYGLHAQAIASRWVFAGDAVLVVSYSRPLLDRVGGISDSTECISSACVRFRGPWSLGNPAIVMRRQQSLRDGAREAYNRPSIR